MELKLSKKKKMEEINYKTHYFVKRYDVHYELLKERHDK